VEILDLPDSDILEGTPNVFYEALLEVIAVVALQSQFMIMGDDTTHEGLVACNR
jgi:hypothetical protein